LQFVVYEPVRDLSGGLFYLEDEMRKFATVAAVLMVLCLPAMAQTRSVTLAWDANPTSDQVTKYSIYQSTIAAGPFTKVADTAATATTYTVIGLSTGTTYYWRLTASNTWAESAPSAVVSATPLLTPGAPQNLRVTPLP
jgi:hypothetical protein